MKVPDGNYVMDSITIASKDLWADYGALLKPLALCVFIPFLFLTPALKSSPFPLLNGKRRWEFSSKRVVNNFVNGAQKLIQEGFAVHKIFRLGTGHGTVLILSPEYANEIRNDDRLNLGKWKAQYFHAHIPGFQPFAVGTPDSDIFYEMITTGLNRNLDKLIEPLSTEMTSALDDTFTENPEWHRLILRRSVLHIVARLSSLVFLGPELCRNPDWLRTTLSYKMNSLNAAHDLRRWPALLRPLVHWYLPSCRKLRAQLDEARVIIAPVLAARTARKGQSGKKTDAPYTDGLEWMERIAQGRPYDPAVVQLAFSMAAIHITADMLTQVLYDICENRDLLEPLRWEIRKVITDDGWQERSLYKLKLMDSVLKESQRLKPINMVTMKRVATDDIELSDGAFILGGDLVAVSHHNLRDPTLYPDPENFDGYRFLRMREETGLDNHHQLVSASANYLAWGHGKHACPGRFFASNEVKIALCHILLKYDFRYPDGRRPAVATVGFSTNSDPSIQMMIRRRQEEIAL